MMINHNLCLLIGISSYENTSLILADSVANDAQDINAVLVNPKYCAFSTEQVRLLLNEQATLQAMRSAFANLIEQSNNQSTVFIYFSGHGGQNNDASESYLLPTDIGKDFAQTGFSSTELSHVLEKIPARKIIVILDCCHAGGIGQLKGVLPTFSFKSGLAEKDYNLLISGYGKLIIASSRDTENSIAPFGEDNSLFTKHLLAGLKGAAASDDGFVRAFDLFHYLQPKVKKDSRGMQNPFFKAYVEENFPIAFNNSYKKLVSTVEKNNTDDYVFDVFISYLDRGKDVDWALNELQPMLENSGLKIADAHTDVMKGAVRISNMETGFKISRYILLVISNDYLKDNEANFENIMFQDMGIYEGSWRVIPVYWEDIDKNLLHPRLRMIEGSNLAHPNPIRAEQEKQNLIKHLKSKGS